jgi:hypothetical protein
MNEDPTHQGPHISSFKSLIEVWQHWASIPRIQDSLVFFWKFQR